MFLGKTPHFQSTFLNPKVALLCTSIPSKSLHATKTWIMRWPDEPLGSDVDLTYIKAHVMNVRIANDSTKKVEIGHVDYAPIR